MFRTSLLRNAIRATSVARGSVGRPLLLRSFATTPEDETKKNNDGKNIDDQSKPKSKAEQLDESETPFEDEQTNRNNQVQKIRFQDDEESPDYEPQTAKDKFKYYSKNILSLALILSIIGLAAYLLSDLIPWRTNAQSMFQKYADVIRQDPQIIKVLGHHIKAFGRDTGNDGRRNIIDSRIYDDEFGKRRVRIRFNLESSTGKMRVWAEARDVGFMDSELVYLIAQDLRSGKVYTIEDNRDDIAMNSTFGGSNKTALAL